MSDVAILTRLVAELSGRLDALSARVPVRIGTPDVPAPNLVVEVIQSAHGFTIGQVVTNTGVSWNLAVAGDDSIGVVCKVVDADTVWICEWGIVCITGASFAESSVYYLGATAGTPTTTPGTPKRAVFFAVSPTMLLVTNPAKDAAGGGLDAITGPAVLGKAAAGSGVPTAIPAAADDTILGRRAGALTYAKIATAEIADGAVTAIKLAATAVTPAAYGSATQVATFTVDQQGRITLAANVTLTPAWASVTGKPTTLAGYGITDGALSARTISAGTGLSGGGDLTADRTLSLANTSVTPAAYGSATQVPTITIDAQGRITAASNLTVTPAWASVTGKPTYFDTQITGVTDTSDTTNAAALIVSGTPSNTTLTFYEKRPRFNAKWVAGTEIETTAPTTKYQILKYNPVTSKAYWIDWAGGTPRDGDIIYTDTAVASGYSLAYAGKAQSVIGCAAATDGVPAPITASADNFVLGRRGGVLTWAKVDLSQEVSGALPVGNGGTSATDAAGARKSLGGIVGAIAATITSSGTFVVPAGVYRLLLLFAGGGGGVATGPHDGSFIGYVANVSGGSPVWPLRIDGIPPGGGDGGMGMAWVNVSPGETLTVTIGTGGVQGSTYGTDGQTTTISFPSSGGSLTAYGGKGGTQFIAGDGAYVSSSVASARNPVVVDMMSNGGVGSDIYVVVDTKFQYAGASKGSARSLVPGSAYGKGGDAAAQPSGSQVGRDGAVYIYY